jgi:arylsulfatase A-like enzyme
MNAIAHLVLRGWNWSDRVVPGNGRRVPGAAAWGVAWFAAALYLASFILPATAAVRPRPNLVLILCDDLGYGDVRCLNPNGKIATPHLDRLASQGMVFTDAHSSSAVCSPTRYSLMTGRYSWRSRLQSGVLGGLSPRLIEEGRLTVAALLRERGYHTAVIGKWHLGMDWVRVAGGGVTELGIETAQQHRNVDYAQSIRNGPNAVGFDYYFGISASLDMVPYAFIENDRLPNLPTDDKSYPLTLGVAERRTRHGPAAPQFEAEEVLPILTRRAVEHISQRAADAQAGRPFFLYVPLNAPHTPVLPTREWQGRSGISPYADFVMQTDASIGEIIAALDRHNLASNTLVIATSDNGCSPEANFAQLAAAGHHPSHTFRGAKADLFEGGHRVPFIARWPGRVRAQSTNHALIGLVDILATCADLLGVKLPPNAGEDSVSFLPSLLGQRGASSRSTLVHHSINGSFAIRQGHWKLALSPDSGGWSSPRPGSPAAKGLPDTQLYNLETDIGETRNLQARHPKVAARLTALLEQQIAQGRSTRGPPQTNTVKVRLRKTASVPAVMPGRPNPENHSRRSCRYGCPSDLRDDMKIARGAAVGDFGRDQGGEVRVSLKWAVRSEPTMASAKRSSARRVCTEMAAGLRCSSHRSTLGYAQSSRLALRPFLCKQRPSEFSHTL